MQGFLRLWFFVSLCAIALLTVLPAAAQTITGSIAGDVTDSTGAVVPDAKVTVQSVGTGLTRTATTTSTGSYRISELPIGPYRVTAEKEGFKTVLRTADVSTGAVTHSDFSLQVGQRTETVEVAGAAPLIELSPNQNNYVDNAKIENVPLNGRDFNSLLAITPGVQRTPGGGFLAVSINGARTTSNNYFIDGLYNNDRYYGDSSVGQTGVVGIPATLFPPEAIQELGVQQTPSAEFGVKGGAPINMVMKSGTNEWHGTAQWVRHTSFADAANYFAKHSGCNAEPNPCKPTQIRNQQFGGTFGGPIFKDKTFFFVYYEGQRYATSATKSAAVPTPADIADAVANIEEAGLPINPAGQALLNLFPTSPTGQLVTQVPTTDTMDGFGVKIDHRINSRHTLSAKYIYGDSLQSAPGVGLPPSAGNPANLFNSIAPSRTQMAGLSHVWNISNNKILESRFGWNRFAQIIDVNNKIDPSSLGVETGPLSPADFGVPYVYFYNLGYGGYIGGVQGYPITTRPDQTYDWSEHFTWAKGNHTIKIGGNYQDSYTNSLRNRARSGLVFGGYFSPYEEILLGKSESVTRNFGDTHRHIIQKSVGFYGQDDWKVRPGLTLTFGLRWEVNGALGEKDNIGANFIPGRGLVSLGKGIDSLYNKDLKDFGPRLGFAWDVFHNGKTALRGGYALTYDVPNFASIAAPYSFAGARAGAFSQPFQGQFSSNAVSLTGDTANDPINGNCLDPNNPGDGGDFVCFGPGVQIFGDNPTGTPPFNAFSIVRNLKTPRLHMFNLSLQHEIVPNQVLTLTYSGSRGQNMILYYDLNASPLGSDCTNGSNCQSFRPLSDPTGFQHIIQATNLAESQYDSLQMSFAQRNVHGLNLTYNYTWSKCFDDNSVNRGGAGDYPQLNNPLNVADTRGRCDHDVTNNFNISGVYDFPTLPAVPKAIGKGWALSTVFTAIGGRPFTPLVGGSRDFSGQGLNGNAIRAQWDGTPIQYNPRDPDHYIGNPEVFSIPAVGTVGNARRNMLRGPGLAQWDATVIKNTNLTEKLTVQFRWEVYNVLNRANFGVLPLNSLTAGGFGTVDKTPDVAVGNPVIAQGGPRSMNFAIKFIF